MSDVTKFTIFDLDGTLLDACPVQDKITNYMRPLHEMRKDMVDVFIKTDNKAILTARHPVLEEYIRKFWFDECPIICRNFCLDNADDNDFIDNVIQWKCGVINQYAQWYDTVMVYDDMIDLMRPYFVDNVDGRLPL